MYKPNGRWADTAAGLVKTAKLKGKLKADASPSMLSLSNASEEIAKALRNRQDAASAALYGLCAIGRYGGSMARSSACHPSREFQSMGSSAESGHPAIDINLCSSSWTQSNVHLDNYLITSAF